MKNIANYISISRIIMSIALLIPKTFSITFYIIKGNIFVPYLEVEFSLV